MKRCSAVAAASVSDNVNYRQPEPSPAFKSFEFVFSVGRLTSIMCYSHVPVESSCFLPFENGLNAFLKCFSHMTLKYVIKIKGAADPKR